MNRVWTACAAALVFGCGVGTGSPPPAVTENPPIGTSADPNAGIPAVEQPPAPTTVTVKVPVVDELSAAGGRLVVLRMPADGPAAREVVDVAPGTAEVSLVAPAGESLALSQQTSTKTARSLAVVQAGCENPFFDTGVIREVPAQFATIQAAIDASDPGDVVLVGPGVWHESLKMRPGVRLRGSGASSTTLEWPGGADTRNIIDLTAAPGVVVSGFTFSGAPGGDFGCAQPDDALLCGGWWYAAAIYGDGHWLEYENYLSAHPEIPRQTAAPSCSGASALITQNVFRDNFISVLAYFHTRVIVSNNVFVDDGYGVAANHLQDRGMVLNNVFAHQTNTAIALSAAYEDVINNVVVDSSAGYTQEYVQEGTIACNVFHGNAKDEVLRYNVPYRIQFGSNGNAIADPMLVAPASSDFHLQAASPLVDTGCAALGEFDADGTPIDIGAYGGPLSSW